MVFEQLSWGASQKHKGMDGMGISIKTLCTSAKPPFLPTSLEA